MTTALTLLMTAMQLLTMVANTPNLSVEFKNNAIQIANQAIVVAQDEITKSNTIQIPQVTPQVTQTVQNTQVLQPSTFGSIISSMEIEANITDERQPSADNPHGLFGITVRVKEQGVYKKVAVTMSAQDQSPALDNPSNNVKVTDTQSSKNANDWSAVFLFVPTSVGSKNITFNYGETSKTLTINAQ